MPPDIECIMLCDMDGLFFEQYLQLLQILEKGETERLSWSTTRKYHYVLGYATFKHSELVSHGLPSDLIFLYFGDSFEDDVKTTSILRDLRLVRLVLQNDGILGDILGFLQVSNTELLLGTVIYIRGYNNINSVDLPIESLINVSKVV